MKTRDIGLDIIRIIAILIIVTFHFALIYAPNFVEEYYGCIGTTIFFMISGYVIQVQNKDLKSLKQFYKKRFIALFPIFWITFIIAYFIHSIRLNNFTYGGPYWKLIFTLLGVDNYTGFFHVDSYYIVGEWFTTIIMLIYIIYPVLNYLIKKYYLETTIVLFSIYYIFSQIPLFDIPHSEDASVFTGTFLFWLGMLCEKYNKVIRSRIFYPIFCSILAIYLVYYKFPVNSLIWRNAVGICLFIILLSMLKNINSEGTFSKGLIYLSSISYSIYLTHHFIAYYLMEKYSYLANTGQFPVSFYFYYLAIVLIVSALIYFITSLILWPFTRKKKIKVQEDE